jgi:hypothetical protein
VLWARLIPLIPAALVCLLVGPSVLRGHIPWFMDIVAQFFPIRCVAAESIHQGLIPLWNPTYYCGVPLLANPQWATLYPINGIFFAVPTGHTFMLGYLIHHIVLASGGYWLARALFPSRLAAIATALVLALGGWTWAHYPFGAYLAVVCWAPWLLGCLERHAHEPRAKWIVTAGILWGLQILAGAPQATLYCSLMFGAMAVIRSLSHRSLAPLRLLVGSLALALLLTAAQWLPTVEFLSHTVRGGKIPLDEVQGGALDLAGPRSLLNALTGGNVFDAAQGEDAESTAFIGWLGLVLALMALLPRPKSSKRVSSQTTSPPSHSPPWPYAVILLLALLWSWSALSPSLHRVMPGYGQFHDPKRALLVAHIALAVLIGGGVSWLLAMRPTVDRISPVILFVLMLGLFAFAALTFPAPMTHYGFLGFEAQGGTRIDPSTADLFPQVFKPLFLSPDTEELTLLLGVVGPLLILMAASVLLLRDRSATLAAWLTVAVALSLLAFGQRQIDTRTCSLDRVTDLDGAHMSNLFDQLRGDERTPAARIVSSDRSFRYSYDFRRSHWRWELLPNQAGTRGLLDAQGFDPAIPVRARLFYRVLNEGFVSLYTGQLCLVHNWLSPLIDLMAVQRVMGDYLIGPPHRLISREDLRERYETRNGPPENLMAQPRLVHRASFVATPDLDSAVRALRLLGDRVRETAILEIPSMSPGEYRAPTGPESDLIIHRITESPNQIMAEIEAPVGWVVLRDQILPGWRAWIDDTEVLIVPADVLFRAVEWPGGRHTLRFTHEPTAFRLGWFISLVTATVLLAGALRPRDRVSPLS